jgi:hypothetical protein
MIIDPLNEEIAENRRCLYMEEQNPTTVVSNNNDRWRENVL